MNKQRFSDACKKIINVERQRHGIGMLGEKTLHAVLKHYFEPNEPNHEIKLGGFFADIVGENGIIEIQTRQFNALRKKLTAFLAVSKVTIVYPVAKTKWLCWIDEQTGETTNKRKSPKSGTPYEIFHELYMIKQMLQHENLRFCIVMLDIEEYRNLNGYSKDKKKGSSRFDRIPIDIREEIYINNISDYKKLIPETLNSQFTAKDFKKASGLSLSASQTALNVLFSVGAAYRVGKQGNAFLYKMKEQ